jgi:hypothetical protein
MTKPQAREAWVSIPSTDGARAQSRPAHRHLRLRILASIRAAPHGPPAHRAGGLGLIPAGYVRAWTLDPHQARDGSGSDLRRPGLLLLTRAEQGALTPHGCRSSCINGRDAGVLDVRCHEHRIELARIALLPEHHHKGSALDSSRRADPCSHTPPAHANQDSYAGAPTEPSWTASTRASSPFGAMRQKSPQRTSQSSSNVLPRVEPVSST